MTTDYNPYPAQVADLIEQGLADLGNALTEEPGDYRASLTAMADGKLKAAQAIATLAQAQETRVAALATLAGLDPVKVQQAGELPREAYTAAAMALGLVEDEDPPADVVDALIAGGLVEQVHADGDPADADLGDLK